MEWHDTPYSSNIKRYSYGAGVLSVEFRHGGVYEYSGVPRLVFDEMNAAESKGKFLAQKIKGTYPFKKMAITEA